MPAIAEKTVTKTDFINALRSGKFQQYTGGSMACDGKVCAMMVFELLANEGKLDGPLGADLVLGHFPARIFNRIADLNDSGMTFTELADVLENHLAEDFQTFTY